MPGNTPFDDLHDIIQISMGWRDEYPFEFTVNETTVRDFGPELDMGDNSYERDAMDSVLDELVTTVNTSLHTRITFMTAGNAAIPSNERATTPADQIMVEASILVPPER